MTYSEMQESILYPVNQRIPLLSDVLSLARSHNLHSHRVHINIELKGRESDLASAVIDEVIAADMLGHIHLSSFDHAHAISLETALAEKQIDTNLVPFGYLVWEIKDLEKTAEIFANHDEK